MKEIAICGAMAAALMCAPARAETRKTNEPAADASAIPEEAVAEQPDTLPEIRKNDNVLAAQDPYIVFSAEFAGNSFEKDPHALGDWGGIRTELADVGIYPQIQYFWQPMANLNGGTRRTATQQGQLSLGLKLDAAKLVGIEGGTVQMLITKRSGAALNNEANLATVWGPQAYFGAGQIWRLADLWYSQDIGNVNIKAGRLSMSEDFGSGVCFHQSIYFCGTKPGHVAAQYYMIGPMAVWGGRVMIKDSLGYTKFGVYERNATNYSDTNGFDLSTKGATGVIVPVERAFKVNWGAKKALNGVYRFGVWYDTSSANDLVRDEKGGYAAISGLPYDRIKGRLGAYAIADQYLRAPRRDGRGGVETLITAVVADKSTNTVSNFLSAQLVYTGPFAIRPHDKVGIAFGRIHMNSRLTDLELAQRDLATDADTVAVQRNEYMVEATYALNIEPGLSLRPNIQYYINPGADRRRSGIVVVGFGAFLTL